MKKPLPHLSLAEELLLLGLRPDRGSTRVSRSYVEYGVAGAVLAELDLAGCVVQERGRVHVRNPIPPARLLSGPTADPVAVAALERLGEPGKGRHGGVRTSHFVRRSRQTVMDRCLERLVERGLLRQEAKKVWGVFPVVRYPVAGEDWPTALRDRLAVAAKSGFPEHRDQLLCAFLYATGLAGRLFPGRAGREPRARMREFARREWTAKAVRKEVQNDEAAASGGGG
ncbi:GPP34 family phosphoprotein [Streptomyces sp. NPDC058657]|uniref:GOLPH3/VPS74 family protein n=1 Tax=unclassified Streptomyces TaxID=2593676 RepID=UPI00365D52D9